MSASAVKKCFDVVVVGGGVMGCSVAYWLRRTLGSAVSVAVVERDPSYIYASTPKAAGGVRAQFSSPGNVAMSLFSAEFIKDSAENFCPDDAVSLSERGYLLLARGNEGARVLKENASLQRDLGASTKFMEKADLETRFPWMETGDLAGASIGEDREGWFDPYSLLSGFRRSAKGLGAEFIQGDALSFRVTPDDNYRLSQVNVKAPDGSVESIVAGSFVNAAGAWASHIYDKVFDGRQPCAPLPVCARKRDVFVIDCPGARGVSADIPMVIDPTGAYFRPEGPPGQFICGRSPDHAKDPDILCEELYQLGQDAFEATVVPDDAFFEGEIWPIIAARCSFFEGLKVVGSWSGLYEYNTLDQNGIIGVHPDVSNFYLCCGFSGHGAQQAPAVGRALAELISNGRYETINLDDFGFSRIAESRPMLERNIW